eukprot:scaffold20065_cov60-Phaeocystis_antarctica.AAC.1
MAACMALLLTLARLHKPLKVTTNKLTRPRQRGRLDWRRALHRPRPWPPYPSQGARGRSSSLRPIVPCRERRRAPKRREPG